jgi:hypothetical protein
MKDPISEISGNRQVFYRETRGFYFECAEGDAER